jgi:hypothetical protein
MKRSLPIVFVMLSLLIGTDLFAVEDSSLDQRPLAVIFLGNDATNDKNDNGVGETMREDFSLAKGLYEKAGFTVVVVDPPDEKHSLDENLKSALSRVKHPTVVHLMFITHGNADSKHEFSTAIQPDKAVNMDEEWTNWFLGKTHPDRKKLNGNFVLTGTQIKDALRDLIRQNPRMPVYIPTLSCYSGALGQQLADLPGVLPLLSSGATWETDIYSGGKGDPLRTMLESWASHESFEASQEQAWEKQLGLYRHGDYAISIATDKVIGKADQLHLLRTEPQLFIESWCARRRKIAWASKQFCIDRSQELSTSIPEGLKVQAIQSAQQKNQDHLKQFEDIKSKIRCEGAKDTVKTEFYLLEKQNIAQTLEILKSKASGISLDEFKKNAKKYAEYRPDPDRTNNNYAQLRDADERVLKRERARTLKKLELFKKICGAPPYAPGKNLRIDNSNSSCSTAFVDLRGDIMLFFPDLEQDVLHENLPYPETAELDDKTFDNYGKSINQKLVEVAKQSPYRAGVRALEMEMPSLKDFCALVDKSISETREDIECTKDFQASANIPEWGRYLEILSLGQNQFLKGDVK